MMKRMLLFLALLGLAPAAAQAQNLLAYQVQTLQDAATAIGNGTAIESRGASAVSVQVTGTFVGAVTFQGTIDGANWIALEATNANDDSRATTATAPGIYSIVLHGCVQFRARISDYTSGSITVKGRLGQGMITKNGGRDGTFTARTDDVAAVAIKPHSDSYTTAPFRVTGNTMGASLIFDPLYVGEDSYGNLTVLGDSAWPFPEVTVQGDSGGGDGTDGAAFNVVAGSGAGIRAFAAGAGYNGSNLFRQSNSGVLYTSNTTSGGLILTSVAPSAPMIFATGGFANSNEQMRITSAGDVGIGTTSPGAQTHIIAKANNKEALRVQPFSNSYTAAPFEIAGNPSGVTFLFAPLYGDSRQLAHMTMLGDATMPSPTIAIKSSSAAGNETENPTISVFNSSFHGPILAAVGPGFSGSNLLSISDSSYLFSAGSTGGITIMATGSGAPIRFATGGIGTGNERFKIGSDGAMIYPATVTAGGTTGAQTINKVSGTVNFAAGASSLVVTNSLVTANSLVFCTVRTNDSTAVIKNVVPTSGSFTIRLSATATAETSVGFFVINQ